MLPAMPLLASLHFQFAAGDVPEWVHLVPSGTFSGEDGRGPYKLVDPAGVIAASMTAGAKLPVDENHSTDIAAPNGQPSPARGWIVQIEARPDGLWGRVEWNDTGRALLAEKAYRGISPVFTVTKAGRVLRVLRAALTNTPNLSALTALNSSIQEPRMDLTRMRQLLGLPADADEAAILAAMERQAAVATAQAAQITTLQAQVQTAISPDVVTTLQTEVATLKAAGARARAVAAVDAAIAAGKPIAPLRDHYITRHMANPADVETEIGKLPSIHAGGMGEQVVVRHDAGDADGLTETESRVCKQMGLDPKKFAEAKRKKEKAA